MEELQLCPVCSERLNPPDPFDADDVYFKCGQCGRQWKKSEDGWESAPMLISMPGEPKEGAEYRTTVATNYELFTKDLEGLLNKYSQENDSDTPDFILAKYLRKCLDAYNETVTARDKWFDVNMWSEHDDNN